MNGMDTNTAWLDDLIVHLRLRNVRGSAIGDAVSEVRSHCAEAGESPAEAFGDAHAYAQALEFRPDQYDRSGFGGWVTALGPTIAGLVGLMLATSTARAARLGTSVEVTWGAVASLALLAVIVAVLNRTLPWLYRHAVALAVSGFLALTAMTTLSVLITAPAFLMSVPIAAVLTAVLLGLSVVLQFRANRVLDDPVTDPIHHADMLADTPHWTTRYMTRAQPWMFVVVSAILAALTWFTAR